MTQMHPSGYPLEGRHINQGVNPKSARPRVVEAVLRCLKWYDIQSEEGDAKTACKVPCSRYGHGSHQVDFSLRSTFISRESSVKRTRAV